MSDKTVSLQQATILVVDDTPQNLSLMSGLLEEKYAVKLAPSGMRALKIVSTAPPDLILLDVMMPEMDGYEVCRKIKENTATRDIPVIFLTAMDSMEDEEKGLGVGAIDYITKPISPSILLARVSNQLALKAATDSLREQNQLLEQERVRARELLFKLKNSADQLLDQNRQLKQEKERIFELTHTLAAIYQAQGQLELAWENLRQCPITESLMEDLYKLGLNFENHKKADDANEVFRHMASFNPNFRDLGERLKADHSPNNQTLSLGRSAIKSADVPISSSAGKATLGRYQIDRELGRGAMGTVYLGTDPMIGRVVAIKTLKLSSDTDANEQQTIKESFFREAESAGRLTHPNIVAIYDVGEERGLAYIAMEFLKGGDLSPWAKPENLLPLEKVLSITEKVAEALDYAHKNGVIHRDIKPANIVYDRESDSIKVTDFGIASIANSSTQGTGIIAGTPYYMSPEQIRGDRVDGRSDLYSLGVMLYLLACGHLPFQAESLAQVMLKITNDRPDDIRSNNALIPDCVATLIDKALSKDPDLRYQNGLQMAKDLSLCRRSQMVFT